MLIQTTGSGDYHSLLRMFVGGQPGAGKTRFAATFPNPIYANCRGGMMSIADKGVPYTNINSIADLLELKLGLEGTPEEREALFGRPVDTLVIDTIDEFVRIMLAERLWHEKRTETSASDYGWLGQRLHTIFEGLDTLPVHVIVLGHLKDVTDDNGKLFIKPGIVGAFCDQIHQYMDYSLLLQSRHWGSPPEFIEALGEEVTVEFPDDHTQLTYLRTYSDATYEWVRDMSGTLPPEFEVNFEDDYARLIDLITAKSKDLTEGTSGEVYLDPEAEPKLVSKDGSTASFISKSVEDVQATKVTIAPPSTPRAKEAVFEGATTDVKCTDCDNMVENEDRRVLSMIRYREPLCSTCFQHRWDATQTK